MKRLKTVFFCMALLLLVLASGCGESDECVSTLKDAKDSVEAGDLSLACVYVLQTYCGLNPYLECIEYMSMVIDDDCPEWFDALKNDCGGCYDENWDDERKEGYQEMCKKVPGFNANRLNCKGP